MKQFPLGFCALALLSLIATAHADVGDLNEAIRAAQAAESREDHGESIRLYSLILASADLPPEHKPTAYYNRALAFRADKQPGLAIADFSEAIRLRNNFVEAYTFRGAAYLDKHEADKAIADLEHAIHLRPSYPEAHYYCGVAYMQKDMTKRAFVQFDKAIRLNPKYAMAYHKRGLVRAVEGKYKEAIPDFDAAILLQPSLALSYSDRGMAYYQMGRLDRAIADLDMAVQTGANDAVTRFRRGMMLYESKRKDRDKDALSDFDMVIQFEPETYPEAYLTRGRIIQNNGDDDRAIEDYTTAIRLKPDYLGAYFNRGLARESKGDADSAISDFDRVIQLQPAGEKSYYFRGLGYAQKGDFDRAHKDFVEALRLNHDDAQRLFFLRMRGQIYFAEGKFADARETFEQALRISARDNGAFLWHYLTEERMGERQRDGLERKAAELDVTEWPDAVILYFAGKATAKDMAFTAKSDNPAVQRGLECEVVFYRGEYELLQKNISQAKQLLNQAASTCPNDSNIKFIARRELQRIGG